MNQLRAFIWYWLPVLIYMGLIFHTSSGPVPQAIRELNPPDSAMHIVEYGVLSALIFRASRHAWGQKSNRAPFLMAIAWSVGFGILDEWHQGFVPTRTADLRDVLSDVLGALLGVLVMLAFQHFTNPDRRLPE